MKPVISKLCALAVMTVVLSGGLVPRAEARLGETKEQLIERYGEPLRESEPELPASDSATIFFKDTVEVQVEFKDGKAWMVTYRTHKLTTELEVQFRDANDGVDGLGEWKEPVEHLGRTYWTTDDRDYYGVRYFVGNGQIFRFCTANCLTALVEARKTQIDKAIAGGPDATAGAAAEAPAEEKADATGDEKEENPF